MAITLGTAAVAGGANLLGQGINAFVTGKMNRKTRKWNEQMYQRQFDDNLRLWHMQNAYNSPREQMQRLQESGLNPNLVYGNGSATEAASAPRGADRPTWSPNAPQIDIPSAMGTYFDFTQRKAQNDILAANARAANADADVKEQRRDIEVTNRDQKLIRDTMENTGVSHDTVIKGYKMNQLAEMWSMSVEHQRLQNQYLSERIKTEPHNRQNIVQQALRHKLENNLRQMGINPNDSIWARVIGRLLNIFVPKTLTDALQSGVDGVVTKGIDRAKDSYNKLTK